MAQATIADQPSPGLFLSDSVFDRFTMDAPRVWYRLKPTPVTRRGVHIRANHLRCDSGFRGRPEYGLIIDFDPEVTTAGVREAAREQAAFVRLQWFKPATGERGFEINDRSALFRDPDGTRYVSFIFDFSEEYIRDLFLNSNAEFRINGMEFRLTPANRDALEGFFKWVGGKESGSNCRYDRTR